MRVEVFAALSGALFPAVTVRPSGAHALCARAAPRGAARLALEAQPVRTPIDADSCALVVGASRGLGLEFARQLAARGARVFATHRGTEPPDALAALVSAHAGRVRALPLDVGDDTSIATALAAVQKLAQAARPLSHVVHNAGVYGPARGLGSLQREALLRTFEVNAVGPVLLAQRAKALLRPPSARGASAVYALLSSKMGSVEDNSSGGSYGYRMSKSALVIAAKSLAIDLGGQAGVVCLHPGYVRTDMTGGGGLIDVDESVRGMLAAIEATDGGTPFRWVDFKAEIVPY
ncbi:hypothetical protein KFE25_011816 [Diacronema lutheri]|uniref:Uncharacterized protein n=2 Tax=Diacronema lutheri TaxID=2081491 RepID=A0A8J6C838_DIALT|nr:hypothetical protein KFE25_011816 [Diacronema lutheri]